MYPSYLASKLLIFPLPVTHLLYTDRRHLIMGCNCIEFLHIFYKHSLCTMLGDADAPGAHSPVGEVISNITEWFSKQERKKRGCTLFVGMCCILLIWEDQGTILGRGKS